MNESVSRKRSPNSDDAPELTTEWFARADLYEDDKFVRRGWQTRIIDTVLERNDSIRNYIRR